MPWNIAKGDERCPASKPYAVVGGSGGNKLFGCHPDKDSAREQQKALYAQEDNPRTVEPVMFTTPTTVCW